METSLRKVKLIPLSQELEFVSQTSNGYKVYGYESKLIEWYNDLEEVKEAFDKYFETESEVIAYEIIGPEHGFGDPNLDIDWDRSDESPEFHFLYDANKNLISSYFYDIDNPGGDRLEGEKTFNKGEIVYVRKYIYLDDNYYELLVPCIIEGKVTIEYLKKAIKEGYIYKYNEEPSEKIIQRKIDNFLNIDKDSLIFKPLVTVKCNWGEEPSLPYGYAPRIDFFPSSIIV